MNIPFDVPRLQVRTAVRRDDQKRNDHERSDHERNDHYSGKLRKALT
jgi:hypothetical protein